MNSIAGEARLNESNDEYQYLGLGVQRARLRDYGFFVADTWRWRPNVTLNIGLRYELQQPFYPLNNSYSKASIDDVCGRSGAATPGSCNIFQQGVQPGRIPQFLQDNEGDGAQHRSEQLRAEPRDRMDPGRLLQSSGSRPRPG